MLGVIASSVRRGVFRFQTRFLALLGGVLLSSLLLAPQSADAQGFTGGTFSPVQADGGGIYQWSTFDSGNFLNFPNMSPGDPPNLSNTEGLLFGSGSSAAFTANNDFAGIYTLGALRFASNGGQAITLTGNTLSFSGSNPFVQLHGATNITIANNLVVGANTSISTDLTGHANLTTVGTITLAGNLEVAAPNNGTSTVRLLGDLVVSGNRTINNNNGVLTLGSAGSQISGVSPGSNLLSLSTSSGAAIEVNGALAGSNLNLHWFGAAGRTLTFNATGTATGVTLTAAGSGITFNAENALGTNARLRVQGGTTTFNANQHLATLTVGTSFSSLSANIGTLVKIDSMALLGSFFTGSVTFSGQGGYEIDQTVSWTTSARVSINGSTLTLNNGMNTTHNWGATDSTSLNIMNDGVLVTHGEISPGSTRPSLSISGTGRVYSTYAGEQEMSKIVGTSDGVFFQFSGATNFEQIRSNHNSNLRSFVLSGPVTYSLLGRGTPGSNGLVRMSPHLINGATLRFESEFALFDGGDMNLHASSGTTFFIDNTSVDGNVQRIATGTPTVTLAGGTFRFLPNNSDIGNSGLGFGALQVHAGQSTIEIGSGSAMGAGTITHSSLTRLNGGTVGFVRHDTDQRLFIGGVSDGDFLGGTVFFGNQLAKYSTANGVVAFDTFGTDFNVLLASFATTNYSGGTNFYVDTDAGFTATVADGTQTISALRLRNDVTLNSDTGTSELQFIAASTAIGSSSGGVILAEADTSSVINTPMRLQGSSRDLIVHVGDNADLQIAGNISRGTSQSGDSFLTKAGAGSLLLTGSNAQHGTFLTAGMLLINGESALGDIGAGVTFSGTAALGVTGNASIGGARTINILSSSLATLDTADHTLDVGAQVAGLGALRKTGSGTLLLQNNFNTYAGGTEIHQGVVSILGNGALGTAPTVALEMTSNLTFSGAGTLRFGEFGSDFTIDAQRWVALNDGANATFDSEGNYTTTIAGKIWGGSSLDIGGSGSLVKTGVGTLVLAGANTYHGVTTVNQGTLVIATEGNYTGGVTVNATGRLHLDADLLTAHSSNIVTINSGGVVSGEASVREIHLVGGTLSPGNSPGTITSSATNVTNGVYQWEINALAPTGEPGGNELGQGWDFWDAGNVTITGPLQIAIYSLDEDNNPGALSGWDPLLGDQNWWIAVDSNGGFADALNNGYLSVNDSQFFDAFGGFSLFTVGNELWLHYSGATPIPEPGSMLLLSLAAGGFGFHRLRRRRK